MSLLFSNMFQKLYILLLFLSFPLISIAGNVADASGLQFKSNGELIESRTSLDLYNGDFQKMTDSFSIQFDISIWDIYAFGYVFRLVNKKQEGINLIFVTFRGDDSLHFDFNSDITNKFIHIPVSREILKKENWLPISMHFDLIKDEATVTIQETSYVCTHVGLHNPDSFRFIFGLYGTNLDVAAMALKNIVITKNNNKSEVFPLGESHGNTVYNSKGVAKGYVKNPVWLINKHYEWEKITEFAAARVAGITYNNKTDRVLAINPDSITMLDMNTHSLNTIKNVQIPFKTVSGEAIYDLTQNCCYVYTFDDTISHKPSFSTIDFRSNPPAVTSGYATINNRLHHHNVFLSEDEQELYVFGGYGKYTYSNAIYKFNPINDRWDSLVFTGDTICPRFFAASGRGPKPNEILIYGGYGNQSGQQELGGKNLYDLYQIDLTNKKIKKLWEQKITDELFVPCGNLILDKDKTHFYTLCYPHHVAKTEFKLYKFSLKDGSYEVVSNTIPIQSEKLETEAFLFFDESLQEFVAVAREYVNPEQSNVRIYLLYSPPVSFAQLNSQPLQKTSGYLLTIFISLFATAGFVSFVFYIRKNRQRKEENGDNVFSDDDILSEKNTLTQEEEEINPIPKSNALYVLGDFCVFDKNGKDITYRFSVKLQSLVAAILLSQKIEGGITTQKLTSNLWPGKSSKDAKNIRGVTINHLRNILEDMEDIQLVNDNSKWFFSINDNFYCDYLHAMKIISEIPKSDTPGDLFQQFAELVKRGSLFRNTETEWIDDFKQKFETSVEQLLTRQLETEYDQGNYQNALNLSDALFVIDPLNEEALLVTIRILKKSGKIEHSQNLYNRFSLRYKATMGKDYSAKYISI